MIFESIRTKFHKMQQSNVLDHRKGQEFKNCSAEVAQAPSTSWSNGVQQPEPEPKTITINPIEIAVVSPQEACELYGTVKLNTILNIVAKINRQLTRKVADFKKITIEEKQIQPDEDTDTLCIFNDNIRDGIIETYKSKGWAVEIKNESDKFIPTVYVFEPAQI